VQHAKQGANVYEHGWPENQVKGDAAPSHTAESVCNDPLPLSHSNRAGDGLREQGGGRWRRDLVDDGRVREGQSQVGHPRQLAVDQYLARYVAANHQPIGVDGAVDLLHHIQIYFVVGVFDALLPPPDAAPHRTFAHKA
jgi:hypothetical protein